MNNQEISKEVRIRKEEIHTPWWRIALAISFGLALIITIMFLTGTIQSVGAILLSFLGVGVAGGLHLVVVQEATEERKWARPVCAILNLGAIFVIGYGITMLWDDLKDGERLLMLAAVYHFGALYFHRKKKKK